MHNQGNETDLVSDSANLAIMRLEQKIFINIILTHARVKSLVTLTLTLGQQVQ